MNMELEATDKKITILSIGKEINPHSMCEKEHFYSLAKELEKNGYGPAAQLSLNKTPGNILPNWLKTHPEAAPWLIKHGYATEKPVDPIIIKINTKEEARVIRDVLGSLSDYQGKTTYKIYCKLDDDFNRIYD